MQSLLKMSMLLQTALATETRLAGELTLKLRCTVKVSDRPSGYAQTNCIKNRWATNFAFKNINKEKGIKMPPP
jgi:hypothetical protein